MERTFKLCQLFAGFCLLASVMSDKAPISEEELIASIFDIPTSEIPPIKYDLSTQPQSSNTYSSHPTSAPHPTSAEPSKPQPGYQSSPSEPNVNYITKTYQNYRIIL